LRETPSEAEPEEDEKKDPRGPRCCECSSFGHMREDCRNLKQAKGKAYNATYSKFEEKETSDKDQKYLAFVAPHEELEGSQSYYLESSNKGREELKEACGLLQETNKKNVKEPNNLKMEKGTILQKITDLEDRLMEVQLQLEKFSDNKLAQMLTGQKCSSDKTGLGYVATTDASNIASTSQNVFVKPSVPNSQNACGDRGKTIVPKSLPTCHHCGMVGHIRPNCCQLNSPRTWKDAPKKNKGVENDSKSKYVPPHKRLPTHRFVPTCHHCGISGHI
jgi:hypothetical protein